MSVVIMKVDKTVLTYVLYSALSPTVEAILIVLENWSVALC